MKEQKRDDNCFGYVYYSDKHMSLIRNIINHTNSQGYDKDKIERKKSKIKQEYIQC